MHLLPLAFTTGGSLRLFWCTTPFLVQLSLSQTSYTQSLSPGSPVSYNDLVSLFRQLPPSLLLLGDFNLRIPLCYDSVTSPHAHFLRSFLTAFSLSCLSEGLPTHCHCQTSSFSCIDVSLCSSSALPFLSWCCLSSFHVPRHLSCSSVSEVVL